MDMHALASDAVTILAPMLPFIKGLGDKAVAKMAEEMGKNLGADTWSKVKALMTKVGPRLASDPAAAQSIAAYAESPGNEDYRAALVLDVLTLLQQDAILAAEMEALIRGSAGNTTFGDRSVIVNGNLSGSPIITGNHNRVVVRPHEKQR